MSWIWMRCKRSILSTGTSSLSQITTWMKQPIIAVMPSQHTAIYYTSGLNLSTSKLAPISLEVLSTPSLSHRTSCQWPTAWSKTASAQIAKADYSFSSLGLARLPSVMVSWVSCKCSISSSFDNTITLAVGFLTRGAKLKYYGTSRCAMIPSLQYTS